MRLVPIFFVTSVVAAAAASGIACGSSSSSDHGGSGTDASSDGTGITPAKDSGGGSEAQAEASGEASPGVDAGYPSFLPTDIPQVVNTRNGPVMAAPKIVPIFFATDDPTMTASIQDFVNKVGATNYWKVMQEYGSGPAIGEPGIQLTHADDPPLVYDDNDLANWLANKIAANDPSFPPPDSNTIYTFFFPPGVTITQGGTSSGFPPDGGFVEGGVEEAGTIPSGASVSCTDFGGYHSAFDLEDGPDGGYINPPGNIPPDAGVTAVAYAVVPRCQSFDGFQGIDAVTSAASHEIAETASDPFLSAFRSTDRGHNYWSTIMGGGEIGDMCAQNLGSFVKFSELPYQVQRLWSNETAMKGGDPCVPVPSGEVYFNTFPIMPDTLQVSAGGHGGVDAGTVSVPGVKIAVGSSKTIELDLASTGPTSGPWTVQAYDLYDLQLASAQQLKFTYSAKSGQNGDKIQLTIQVVAEGTSFSGQPSPYEPFLIISTLKNGTQNLWAGEVGN